MKNLFIIYISLLGLISCNNKKEKNDSSVWSINLDLKTDSLFRISDFKCIPLETSDSCLIGRISKIICKNQKFYILDKQENVVFVFDKDGRLVRKVNRVGTGPGEYLFLSDMDVDSDGNIYISDNQSRRIIKYYLSDSLDKYETINIEESFLEFTIADSGTIYLSDVVRNGKMTIKLAKFDRQTREIEILEESTLDEEARISRFSNHYFYRSADALYYYKRFAPTIYKLDQMGNAPCFSLKSDFFPNNEKIQEWKSKDLYVVLNDFEYIRDLSACYETDGSFFIAFQTTPALYTVIDRKTRKTCNFNLFPDRRLHSSHYFFTYDNQTYASYCSPTSQTIQHILADTEFTDDKHRDRIIDLSEDSNPVILLFRLTSF